MKINYRRYPILEFFDKSRLTKLDGKINLRGEDREIWYSVPDVKKTAMYTVNEMYRGYIADRCGEKVYILTPKFMEAIKGSSSAFKNISRGVQLEKLYEDCCIFAGDMVYVCYKLTADTYLGHELNTAGHPNNYMMAIYYQGTVDDKKDRHVVYLGTLVFNKKDDKQYSFNLALLSKLLGQRASIYKEKEQIVDAVLAVLLFKHYAKVELDVISGNERKLSAVANEKVINETPKGVHIMDSNWYTSIYREEGFDVKGHIRYYKVYDTIAYVHPHQRKGYVRRAKVLDDPTAEPDTTEHDMKLRALENSNVEL